MTKIGICDDDKALLDKIYSVIENYHTKNTSFTCSIEKFSNSQIIFDKHKQNAFDLLLLDINMKPINGIQLAEQIRKIDNKVFIIFLTGYSNFFENAFKVHAFEYLLKPVSAQKIHNILDEYYRYTLERVDDTLNYFVFTNNKNEIKIKIHKMIYIEQRRNLSTIVTSDKRVEFYATLKEIGTHLPEYFVQCHKSFIVNLNHVTKRDREICKVSNGSEVPIGRQNQKKFKEVYIHYLKNLNSINN